MSEFSTIVNSKCVLFTGSNLAVKENFGPNKSNLIIVCPKEILKDVENILNQLDNNIGPNKMDILENESQVIGPFSIIKNEKVMAFGQQEVILIPKLDILMQHRLRCLLGLTTKLWLLKGLELVLYEL